MPLKDAGMRIRVERPVREAFVRACRACNRPAADVLRDFMRAFTDEQLRGQADLFEPADRK